MHCNMAKCKFLCLRAKKAAYHFNVERAFRLFLCLLVDFLPDLKFEHNCFGFGSPAPKRRFSSLCMSPEAPCLAGDGWYSSLSLSHAARGIAAGGLWTRGKCEALGSHSFAMKHQMWVLHWAGESPSDTSGCCGCLISLWTALAGQRYLLLTVIAFALLLLPGICSGWGRWDGKASLEHHWKDWKLCSYLVTLETGTLQWTMRKTKVISLYK